jgi:4-amino-4-deoxy-L-arabinose transferase-like glycosyltransferase
MCILTAAILLMLHFTRTMKMRFFVIAAALCGLGVITRLTMILALGAFVVYLTMVFWKDRKRLVRLIAIGATIQIPFAVWQMYYNHVRTGHMLISPVQSDQYASSNGLSGNLALGMFGLLFSPGKSIFLYIPIVVLSVVCFRRFASKYAPEAAFVGVLFALWLGLHAKLATNWYGAWGWGPRHFITIAPVLALPALVNWEWIKASLWKNILLKGALLWGALLSVCSIIGNWHFRMALADAQNRHDAMLWSYTNGQAIDMIKGALSNIRNMVLGLPGPCLPTYSAINCNASNTVNVWINSAAYAGIPKPLLAAVGITLLAVAFCCWIALQKIGSRSTEKEVLVPCES